MYKFKKIFKDINFNLKIPETPTFNLFLDNYLSSISEEDIKNIEKIFYCLKINYSDNKLILFDEIKIYDDSYYILSLFIFKIVSKSNLLPDSHNNFFTNDEILNKIISNYKNFYIFYLKKEITQNRLKEIRGEIFKILNMLILNNILFSKKYYTFGKTIEYLSFSFDRICLPIIENLKISPIPLKLHLIEDSYYLIGEFFTMIKKVFTENNLSNYYFKLNSMDYLEKLINTPIYINIYDLEEAIKIVEDDKFRLEDTKKIIFEKSNKIKENNLEIKEKNKKFKEKLSNETSWDNLSFIETKKKIINFFMEYANNYIEQKIINFDEKEKNNFLNLIYNEFIDIFKNAYFKINFKNLKEFIEWKTKLKEFGFSRNELEYSGNFKKVVDPKNRIKIDEKIDPNKISFLSYLFVLNKKEINESIVKAAKKKKFSQIVLTNEIEFEEDLYLNKDKINIISRLKFSYKYKNDLDLNNVWKEIKILVKENSFLQSEISKISNLYNLYLLYNYCKNNFKINEWGNIEVYFLIFFDFRGRYYYDSVISPTNNKIIRYAINYGILEVNKIFYKANEISIIIQKYINYIEDFKKIFKLEKNSLFINDTIFWLMIAIGKITIKKKKKIEIVEFLENSIETIKNSKIEDYIDKIELNYLVKIIVSLKNEKIIKRCILKDATASFFQNLIRILGAKNDEISKTANLNSTEAWYDWYSFVLDKWLLEEKEKNLITENHNLFTRKTTKRVNMTSSYEASFPTLANYFEEDLIEQFGIELNDDIYQIFIRFYKFLKNNFKNNPDFIKSSSNLDEEFKKILKEEKNIIITSRLNDESNLTYYKTQTKHFDFIIKVENKRKRIIKNYKQITDEIDTKKSMTALKANIVHFVDAMLIRDINNSVYYFNAKMYIAIHDSFMVVFSEVSEFILIANKSINENPFNENFVYNKKKFFSIFIFI